MREMDPDAVVREAESGRSLAGDDAVHSTTVEDRYPYVVVSNRTWVFCS